MAIQRRLLLAAGSACLAAGAAHAAEEQRFASAGVPIRFIEAGRGEPVILVHGYTVDTEAQWVETGVFGTLAEGFRVIGMDARGHGRSGKPHDPAQYGPEMGMDVVRLLDHLGLQRAHIVGYSMGSHVVAQLVTLRPERFATLTLGGACGRLGWTAEDQRRVDVESAEMDQGLLTSQIIRLWPRNQPPPSEAEIRAQSERALAGKDPRALAAVRRSNPAQVIAVEGLAAAPVPMLGVVGTADPYLRDFERLKAARPALQLVTIEGASHGTAPGRPEFVRGVADFLRANRIG
ncbi:alpha/beta hydrolase [Roseomonas sp. KE2513]|uniref:alpha/beta fold hydrolase n=1 Tax=Roseomonas sp. KE2513 TaxID=2479202 RepID=UPI0018DF03FA|nr:alpha/beta hydrolase [Roseomonas sp. KE2513]MBI0534385.1 alpha/beta hydrolase [Roseomonas sp. KE2513]